MSVALINGKIYTVDTKFPWAEAVLVEEGIFTAVGSTEEIRSVSPAEAEIIDLEGHMVMPGLHDAHIHLLASGLKFQYECRLSPASDPEQIVRDLTECHCSGPAAEGEQPWVVGGEFLPQAFDDGELDRRFLDESFPDRPVFLYDYSIHHGLVNSKALELAGLSEASQDPPGGRLIRRPGSRELTGELVEQARWPVMRAIPDYPESTYREALRWAIATCHQYGITSAQEASASPQALHALAELERAGELHLQVAAHLPWREEGFGMATAAELDRSIADRSSTASKHVHTDFVKIWLDGAPLPPHMTQVDLHEDGTVDEANLLVPAEQLLELIRRFDAEGLSVKIHCAGEGSVHAALDAFEGVRKVNGANGPTHEIAHCTFINDADYARFPQLNVVAEMSPAIWHIEEFGLQNGFKFGSILRAGATMTVGSDWIITANPNLFPALQGMLQRGEEAVDLATAVELMTLGGARVIGRANRQGSVQVGKSADLIVLDRNIFEVPADEIGETRVLRTLFEGRTVYREESP
ncbi:amidohydrolase [Haloactinomyces albus]|uniref:Amidohydrolase YtcJ n=1 Tax=Haloactinomyces albus TaxID=1352928 RepID=A0AAE3ZJL0_9ACTN|nr:amidohydrolase [Haloactinomyces albus]MDR7304079.1 putative amidohydrolase YtcJ [Haloactinomyces albus]